MPSSVSGEPNTTPFSAEQKMRCSSSTEHSSHRLVPTEQDLSMQRPLPQNTKGEGHKDPPPGVISQALPVKSLYLTMLYLQELHHPASYLSLITVFIS